MDALLVLAQNEVTLRFDLTLAGLIAVIAGVAILMFPKILNYIVALYLIVVGLIDLFNVRI